MIVAKGEKVHVIYRALYENATRRHFIGEVVEAEGAVCRLEGYVFVLDRKTEVYVKKNEKRTTVLDLSESGNIANIIDPDTSIPDVIYKYVRDDGLIVTDGNKFSLNINEFGAKN